MKIGPVVSAENRLTNGNCVACSRGSVYFVEYLRIYWTDFCNLFTIWKHCMYRWWICTYFPISQVTLPWQPNHLWMSGITQARKWRILSNISGYTGPIFAIFSPYDSSLCTDDGSVPFFYKFGQLPSSNLGVYAVKTCNFCSHAPAILGRSSYVTFAFRNGWKIAILISAE